MKLRLITCALTIVLLAGCTNGGKEATPTRTTTVFDAPRATVAFITHQAPDDTFWNLVRRGAEAAAAKDNIELRYFSDPDAARQADLVRSAVADKVSGIVVTLAMPEVMAPAVRSATAANIPVVAVNSGITQWQSMGALGYFGQDEMIAGQAAGERFTKAGATNALCVIQEPGHVGLEARCAGAAKGFTGRTQKLYVDGFDRAVVKQAVIAKLHEDFSIDQILTLSAPVALAALEAAAEANSFARIATFDTNANVVKAIKNGTLDWAIDQQPYLQGYLAVDSLWLYLVNRNVIGGGFPTLTGPSFVDETNIDSVADLAEAGTR